MHIPEHRGTPLLDQFGGTLPTTEVQFQALFARLRREGHFLESRMMTNTSGRHHFAENQNHDDSASRSAYVAAPSYLADSPFIPEPASYVGVPPRPQSDPTWTSPRHTNLPQTSTCMTTGCIGCASCSTTYSYLSTFDDDERSSNAPDTDVEDHLHEITEYPLDANGNVDEGEVFHDYVVARRRWRSLTGRTGRTSRFRGKGKSKGKGKNIFGSRFKRKSGWSFTTDDGDELSARGVKDMHH